MILHRVTCLVGLFAVGPACATRVGNPPKPSPAAITVPSLGEIVPSTSKPTETPSGGFAGAADFLKSLSSSAPRHREVLLGVNAIGRQVDAMGLELDVPLTTEVGGVEVKAIVRSASADATVRNAVLCTGGKPFYTASWKDGGGDVTGAVDLSVDPLQAFPEISEQDRLFVAGFAFAKTELLSELDMTFDGAPSVNDPFVGELGRVTERARYRVKSEAGAKVVYQGTQLWYDDVAPSEALPQVTVAGTIASDGSYEDAFHHTEAQLICPDPLDRSNVESPGWCIGYVGSADGETGEFTTAAAAQVLWDGIKDDGLIDPQTTVVPVLDATCPE